MQDVRPEQAIARAMTAEKRKYGASNTSEGFKKKSRMLKERVNLVSRLGACGHCATHPACLMRYHRSAGAWYQVVRKCRRIPR